MPKYFPKNDIGFALNLSTVNMLETMVGERCKLTAQSHKPMVERNSGYQSILYLCLFKFVVLTPNFIFIVNE